jgi:hypothetical protein
VTDSRRFGKQLVRDLVIPHILRRRDTPGIQKPVRTKMDCFLGTMEDQHAAAYSVAGEAPDGEPGANQEVEPEVPQPGKRTRRCFVCINATPNKR